MHEFEIGVWKKLFIHLIRLLEFHTLSDGPTLTAELDVRYVALVCRVYSWLSSDTAIAPPRLLEGTAFVNSIQMLRV